MRATALLMLLASACAFPEPPRSGNGRGGDGPIREPGAAPEPGAPGGGAGAAPNVPPGGGPAGGQGGGPTPPPDGSGQGGGPNPPPDADADAPTGEEGPPSAGMGMRCDLTEAAVDPDPDQGKATVSGSVAWEGELTGSVLIDLGRPGDLTPIYGFECRGSGPFSLEVPRALGEVVLLVFVDNDMDGPSTTDPQVRSAGGLDLSEDHAGLALTPSAGAPIAGATFATPPAE